MLSDNCLINYYQENYEILRHNRFTLTELESMYPFERAVYIPLVINELKQRKEELNKR